MGGICCYPKCWLTYNSLAVDSDGGRKWKPEILAENLQGFLGITWFIKLTIIGH